MNKVVFNRLQQSDNVDISNLIRHIQRGLEKESLRIDVNGLISKDKHPKTLGSSLTHPMITTDFSEALLEFITPPSSALQDPWEILADIHRFTNTAIENQMLLPTSMPIGLPDNPLDISIAEYGRSHKGQFKHIYRKGLVQRYGHFMQMIAGIHYNFSLPEAFFSQYKEIVQSPLPLKGFISDQYLSVIRNFNRHSWILPLLFGSSPTVPKILSKKDTIPFIETTDQEHMVSPYATSFRLSPLGYQSHRQNSIQVDYNTMSGYVTSINNAVQKAEPEYERIGVVVDGERIQLSTNLLQIENEHYAWIRPKRSTHLNKRSLIALAQEGIEYLEIRAIDVDPFAPLGISKDCGYFLDTLLMYCLLSDSPALLEKEMHLVKRNQYYASLFGRNPKASWVGIDGRELLFKDASQYLMDNLMTVSEWLDHCFGEKIFSSSVERAYETISDYQKLPSSRMVEQLLTKQQTFHDFALEYAFKHKKTLWGDPSHEKMQKFYQLTKTSHEEQMRLESADKGTFDAYLVDYFKGNINVE